MAQLVAQATCNRQVVGSSPTTGSGAGPATGAPPTHAPWRWVPRLRFSVMENDPPELELRDYLAVLRRRRATVGLTTLVVVAAALVLSLLQDPVYRAETELLLRPRVAEEVLGGDAGTTRNNPDRDIQTQIRIITSEPVKELVRERVGSAPEVSARPVSGTDIVIVAAESTDPEEAAVVANAYAEAYRQFQVRQATQEFEDATAELQPALEDLQARINSLQAEIDGAPAGQTDTFRTQRDSLIQQRALLRQDLDKLGLIANLSSGARVVTPAETPSSPVRPNPVRNSTIALFAGLVLGVGLAFLFDYLDDSIKGKEDIERVAPGATVLGLIPRVADMADNTVVSLSERNSEAAESYRTLRTSIRFLGLDRALGSLQITSPNAYDGKTTTAANLAVVMRQAGFRVALIGADLRRPRVHEVFGLPNQVGFTSVMLGQVALNDALQEVPGMSQLMVLASGPLPPNPSELLSSQQASEILSSLRAAGYFVLVDSPPVIPVTDALVMSRQVDATLLVCSTATSRREAGRAFELFEQVGAPLAGVVLNGVSPQAGYGYYGSYYGQVPKAPGRSERRRGRHSEAGLASH